MLHLQMIDYFDKKSRKTDFLKTLMKKKKKNINDAKSIDL